MADGDDDVAECERLPSLRGGWLVVFAIIIFLLPLLAGMLGAFCTGRWWGRADAVGVWQVPGMLAGVACGILVARLLTRTLGGRGTTTGGGMS